MSDFDVLIQRYIAVWNETDAATRRGDPTRRGGAGVGTRRPLH